VDHQVLDAVLGQRDALFLRDKQVRKNDVDAGLDKRAFLDNDVGRLGAQ